MVGERASADEFNDDEEEEVEDAEVDVLDAGDDIGENDKAPDKANIFDEEDDADAFLKFVALVLWLLGR